MKQEHRDSQKETTFLRVKRVAVFGLFRLYNHDIVLHGEERVTILHGPNGVGKTVLLRLIAAAFDGRYAEFAKVPFKRLEIELSDDSTLSFQQTERLGTDEYVELGLQVSLHSNKKTPAVHEILLEDSKMRDVVARYAAGGADIKRLGPNRWLDRNSGLERSTAEMYDQHFGPHERRKIGAPVTGAEPEWLVALRSRVLVHLIETQRLLRMNASGSGGPERRGPVVIPTVHDYARDLQERITKTLAQYATASQSLDQSFPQRLLKAGAQTAPAMSDLKARMSSLNAKRSLLQKIGLLDAATSSPFDVESLDALAPGQSNVMSLYVEDTQNKLEVLDDLSQRVSLLLTHINGKFRNKSIQINREKGFVVLGADNIAIDPDSLSSGEQHELVQLYDLLFRVKPGTLVLIDEPELSLHVGWQKKFLPELLEIARAVQFDALVATHSPFIVGDRSDLMVLLAADIDA